MLCVGIDTQSLTMSHPTRSTTRSLTQTMSVEVTDTWDYKGTFKQDGWEVISTEDWVGRPSVRKKVILQIFAALKRAAEAKTTGVVPFGMNQNAQYVVRRAVNAVHGFLFGIKTYENILNDDRLPKQSKSGKILYELEYNVLRVWEAPSMAHDAGANALDVVIQDWSRNNMPIRKTLKEMGGGQWVYQIGSEKSPDQSFRPSNIQVNLGARLVAGKTFCYPTFVIEIAKSNETYPELLRDCDIKHFSPLTSVMVWLGVKAYESRTMKAVFKLRDMVRGYGYDRNSGAETPVIPLNQPTQIEFMLPKQAIFFAVPPPLPPTPFRLPGPHCLPQPLNPNILTDDLFLPLDLIREELDENWS